MSVQIFAGQADNRIPLLDTKGFHMLSINTEHQFHILRRGADQGVTVIFPDGEIRFHHRRERKGIMAHLNTKPLTRCQRIRQGRPYPFAICCIGAAINPLRLKHERAQIRHRCAGHADIGQKQEGFSPFVIGLMPGIFDLKRNIAAMEMRRNGLPDLRKVIAPGAASKAGIKGQAVAFFLQGNRIAKGHA